MYKEVVECEKFPGFYPTEEITRVAVSKFGSVIDTETGELIETRNSGGYRYIIIHCVPYRVHTLVLNAFVKKPTNNSSKPLITNHINGVKSDNRLENLEWVTYSGNILHAYKTGLREDNVVVLVKDLRTDEVMSFYSIHECSRYFKKPGATIHWHLKESNYGRVSFGHYLFIREGMDWPTISLEEISGHRNGTAKATLVFNKIDKKAYFFESLGEACAAFNWSRETVHMRLHRARNKSIMVIDVDGYEVCYTKKEDIPSTVEVEYIKKVYKPRAAATKPKHKRILVKNLSTGEEKEYESSKMFAKILGVKTNSFQKYIWGHNGVWKGKYRISYLDSTRTNQCPTTQ